MRLRPDYQLALEGAAELLAGHVAIAALDRLTAVRCLPKTMASTCYTRYYRLCGADRSSDRMLYSARSMVAYKRPVKAVLDARAASGA
jgi:hypothetical protein